MIGRKGVPARRAFLACAACVLCAALACAELVLAASCLPVRAYASAPGPGVASGQYGGVPAVDYGGAAGTAADGGAADSVAADEGGGAGESAGEPSAAAAEADVGQEGAGAGVADAGASGADSGSAVPQDAAATGDAEWKTQLGAWLLGHDPSAVEAALQHTRAQVADDVAPAGPRAPTAFDCVPAAVALALANFAAGLVMLAVGRVKSHPTR